ncbi:MAG: hypothetical protein KJ957_03665 [Candidatus Omnitrophica bacterium]|nr:hypothetical protein [Candidatus Omnitrophota bacterium]
MKKIAGLFIIFCFIFGSTICFGEKNSREFEFARDYIETLRFLKMSVERHRESDPDNANYQNDVDMALTFMKNFRLDNNDLQMAKSLLDKYVNSQNKLIEETAVSILNAYDKLIGINTRILKLYEKLYSPEMVNNPDKVDQGLFMSEASDLVAEREHTEKLLLEANILVTIALVSDMPDEDGFLSYLAINSKEREELIGLIDEIFGSEVRDGKTGPGLTYPDSCGAAIRQVLAGNSSSTDGR